jgi:protein-L-isoaspartate(D-aspartate) O-methyltransferase
MNEYAGRNNQESMLRDIGNEVEFTRREIGKDRLNAQVMAAMAAVPRDRFVPAEYSSCAFADGPLPIGHGQTISQPYMVALMTDLVAPRPDSVMLDVGTGSGYQAAVLAQLVRHVYSMEIIASLADTARARLNDLGYQNVAVRNGDGWSGWPEHAPYDGIVVAAAAPEVPQALIAQLKPGGRLVVPVGPPHGPQELQVVEKLADGSASTRSILLVSFVPMTHSPP